MKKVFFAIFLATLSVATASAQATKIDATKLLKPSGTNSRFLVTNSSGAVAWSDAATLLTAGSGISISGNTISATDNSVTNEIQALTAGDGSGSDITLLLSLSGGTVTLKAGTDMSITRSGNDITFTNTAAVPDVSVLRYEEVTTTAATTITVTGFTPDVDDTLLFVDGVYMDVGTGEDATLAGSTYTFTNALAIGQKVVVRKITLF